MMMEPNSVSNCATGRRIGFVLLAVSLLSSVACKPKSVAQRSAVQPSSVEPAAVTAEPAAVIAEPMAVAEIDLQVMSLERLRDHIDAVEGKLVVVDLWALW